MLTKTKNIRKKSPQKFFSKIQKMSERMAQEKPQLKFERNPCIRFRGNCDMDGRTTDDGQNCDFMSSADIVKQG